MVITEEDGDCGLSPQRAQYCLGDGSLLVRTHNYSCVTNQFLQVLFLAVILFSLILCPEAFCDHVTSQSCVHVCLCSCPCVPYLLLNPFLLRCPGRVFLSSLQPPLGPQCSPSWVPQGSWHLNLSGISVSLFPRNVLLETFNYKWQKGDFFSDWKSSLSAAGAVSVTLKTGMLSKKQPCV